MPSDDFESIHEYAMDWFYDLMLNELNIDSDRLYKKYGVEYYQHYFFDSNLNSFVEVTEEEFVLFRRLRRTFSNNCTCKQSVNISERFDTEIGAMRLVSEDGTWLVESEVEDLSMEDWETFKRPNDLRDRIYHTMLAAHGLSHITNTPRSGAHFIKGWAHPFSSDWYDADCLDLLVGSTLEEESQFSFLVGQLTKAYRLGRAKSDQIWRQRHFKTSHSGAKQADDLKTATRRMSDTASKRAKEKRQAIQKIWGLICEGDPVLSRNDSKAADAIFEHLSENLGDHGLRSMRIKKTGSPIGQDAIRRYLRELRGAERI